MPSQYSHSILQCEPGVFCCRAGYDPTNCCNDTSATFNTSHISTPLPPNGSEVSTTYEGGSSGSPSTCSADHSATIAGAVGGVLNLVLIASLLGLFLLARQRSRLQHELRNGQILQHEPQQSALYNTPLVRQHRCQRRSRASVVHPVQLRHIQCQKGISLTRDHTRWTERTSHMRWQVCPSCRDDGMLLSRWQDSPAGKRASVTRMHEPRPAGGRCIVQDLEMKITTSMGFFSLSPRHWVPTHISWPTQTSITVESAGHCCCWLRSCP